MVCSCGKHSAIYVPPKKKQPGRWMVLAVKVAGHKPRPVTTVTSKARALERVRAVCAGCDTVRCNLGAAAAGPVAPAPHNLRERTDTVNYDDTVRCATCPAGPGRGHKRQASDDVLHTAQAILKKPKPTNEELREALSKLTEQHQLLKRWYGKAVLDRNQAFALLREEFPIISESNKGQNNEHKTIEETEEECKFGQAKMAQAGWAE